MIRSIAATILLMMMAMSPAAAQVATSNEFVTQTPGKNVSGMVGMCVDVLNRAVACGTSGTSGQAVNDVGASNLATPQVVVGTTSTAVVAARAGRKALSITNITGTQPIFCTSGTATLVNGQIIAGTIAAGFTWPYAGALNCIATTVAQTVSVSETY